MWHISYHNSASEQSLNKHSFQFGNDADRLTAAKTNRDQGSSSYNLCMLVVCLRSMNGGQIFLVNTFVYNCVQEFAAVQQGLELCHNVVLLLSTNSVLQQDTL